MVLAGCAPSPEPPARADPAQAMRRAAEFYRNEVSVGGGYHFRYTSDLSFGRSEHASGPTQVSLQRDGTPRVALAFLEAWDRTRDRYYLDGAVAAAHLIVNGQLCSGGWDYIVELDPDLRGRYAYRQGGDCGAPEEPRPTTLDDNVTQAAVRVLMRVDRELEFQDEAIHESVEYALDKLIEAQYPNGAWPQRFFEPPSGSEPVLKASYPENWSREWPGADYRGFYTLNDNTLADMIDVMLEAARIYGEERYLDAARRGGDFLILAQMPDPQPAWAQQYDQQMHPSWARLFEPPSVTGGESQSAMRILLTLYRETGDGKYLEPIPRALEYLNASALPDDPDGEPRKQRTCPSGTPCLARFYELETNRPLYISKGTMVRGLGAVTRPDGYDVTYDDSSVIQHYGMWASGSGLAEIGAELERLREATPAEIRRPDRLHGLSPWQHSEPAEPPSAERLAEIVAALDERGAWVEPGFAGRAEQVIDVFAAAPMTVRIGDKTYPVAENETVTIFKGDAPTVEAMIVSDTFAENLESLAAAVAARTP